jgi:hypothetical protein
MNAYCIEFRYASSDLCPFYHLVLRYKVGKCAITEWWNGFLCPKFCYNNYYYFS